jgi:hypothetical protein
MVADAGIAKDPARWLAKVEAEARLPRFPNPTFQELAAS